MTVRFMDEQTMPVARNGLAETCSRRKEDGRRASKA